MQSLRVGNYGSQIYNRYFVPLIVTVSVAYLLLEVRFLSHSSQSIMSQSVSYAKNLDYPFDFTKMYTFVV